MDAHDNHLAVTKGFNALNSVLAPFVAQQLQAKSGDDWWREDVLGRLFSDQQRDLPLSGDYATLVDSLDIARSLLLVDINWREVFGRKLPRDAKNWVMELKGARNKWAHAGAGLESEPAARMLDTMQLLADQIDPETAEEIREQLRMVRYGSAEGSAFATAAAPEEAKKAALPATVAAGSLPSWRNVIQPHPDVRNGQYQNAEFAADLTQVIDGTAAYEYRDPMEFFARTYITEGMSDLLVESLRRLSGKGGEPVIQLKTAFGGGKTHSMLALYHLLNGKAPLAKIPSLAPVLQKAGADLATVAQGVNVAVLVGTGLNPAKAKRPADMPGITVNTFWGEMAYQIARSAGRPELYEHVREADKKHVSPGSSALRELFDDAGPTLVLMDELVRYANKLESGRDLPAGTLENFVTFIQELTEAAKASRNALIVASIPESDMEIGGESGQEVLDKIEHTFGRTEAIWRPVKTSEGFEVVRRRLFLDCEDGAARDRVVEAFAQMYQQNGSDFPVEARSSDYRESIASCYPIHPEVFDRLYEDWTTIEKFQRTRSVLRLMAGVIHDLWTEGDPSPMIMPGSIPLSEPNVKNELTRYLDESWNGIVDSEVDGKRSVPFKNDSENARFGSLLASRRVARTVFLGSAPDVAGQNVRGIEETRIRLGAVQPGEQIAVFNEALSKLRTTSSYLYSDINGGRYWYDVRPTLRKTVEDRVSQMADEKAVAEVERRLKRLPNQAPFQGVHVAPVSSADVPDDEELRLIVAGPAYPHRKDDPHSPAMDWCAEVLAMRGTSPRQFKNTMVFAAMNEREKVALLEEAKRYLAWNSVLDDAGPLNLTQDQVKETKENIARSDVSVTARLHEAYRWVIYPSADQDDLAKLVWAADQVTGSSDDIVKKAAKRLTAVGAVVPQWAPMLLKRELDRLLWPQSDDIEVGQLWRYLCSYCYLPRLASYSVLEDAIRQGLALGDFFAIASGKEGGRYLGLRESGEIGAVPKSDLLVKKDVAARQVEADRVAAELAGQGGGGTEAGGSGATVVPPKEDEPATKPPAERKPVTFSLSRDLDPLAVIGDVDPIVQEILSQFDGLLGCDLTVTLEVKAHCKDGFDRSLQRSLSENCGVLGIQDYKFGE